MALNVARSMGKTLNTYAQRLSAFRPNARLYLLNVILTGAAMGVFRLLFNFYALSIGLDEALLGNLVTVNSLTALLMVLPMGFLADTLGRKASLLISGAAISLSIAAMVIWPDPITLFATNVIFGVAQSLAGVTMAPFLMENSGEEERTYLFSFGQGLQMVSASLGNWVGGYLPGWMGVWRNVDATHSAAYGGALLTIALASAIGLIPLLYLHTPRLEKAARAVFTPLHFIAEQPVLLLKLILPMLVTSIGAGLIMPFMNVFFREVHHQPDPVIGVLFMWGSLAMGIGLLIAPPLADRMGKIKLVVITQGLSIPFLILLGFAPWFWVSTAAYYIRVALMNMSGPVYQTFVMERVAPSGRATIASLVSMAWNFGWTISPSISGWLQKEYGFGPPFIGTIILYTLSVFLYWAFFWRKSPAAELQPQPAAAPGD